MCTFWLEGKLDQCISFDSSENQNYLFFLIFVIEIYLILNNPTSVNMLLNKTGSWSFNSVNWQYTFVSVFLKTEYMLLIWKTVKIWLKIELKVVCWFDSEKLYKLEYWRKLLIWKHHINTRNNNVEAIFLRVCIILIQCHNIIYIWHEVLSFQEGVSNCSDFFVWYLLLIQYFS